MSNTEMNRIHISELRTGSKIERLNLTVLISGKTFGTIVFVLVP